MRPLYGKIPLYLQLTKSRQWPREFGPHSLGAFGENVVPSRRHDVRGKWTLVCGTSLIRNKGRYDCYDGLVREVERANMSWGRGGRAWQAVVTIRSSPAFAHRRNGDTSTQQRCCWIFVREVLDTFALLRHARDVLVSLSNSIKYAPNGLPSSR